MEPTAEQGRLFPEQTGDDTVFINDRCRVQTLEGRRVVSVCGFPIAHYAVGDRMAEVHAMVQLVEQDWARQTEVARAFGASDRTVRRYQAHFEAGGLAALGRPAGFPKGRRRIPKARDRKLVEWRSHGLSNRVIAGRLGVTEKAVRKGLRRLGFKSEPVAQPALPFGRADPNLSGREDRSDGRSAPKAQDPAAEPTTDTASPAPAADPNLSGSSIDPEEAPPVSMDRDPANRSIDRLMAYLGLLDDAAPWFRPGTRVPGAGVLLVVPPLIQSGILAAADEVYGSIGPAFYGLRTTFVALVLMALLRIKRHRGSEGALTGGPGPHPGPGPRPRGQDHPPQAHSPEHGVEGEVLTCAVDHVEEPGLLLSLGKPRFIEPETRDAQKGQEQPNDHSHDAKALAKSQDLALELKGVHVHDVQGHDLARPASNPTACRGRRDRQRWKQIRISGLLDEGTDTVVVGAARVGCGRHAGLRGVEHRVLLGVGKASLVSPGRPSHRRRELQELEHSGQSVLRFWKHRWPSSERDRSKAEREGIMPGQALVPVERIERSILLIRGHKVMLDTELAEIYGVTTKRLNEQVKRNRDRFPVDFMFQLSEAEFEDLRSQSATAKFAMRRSPPYAFTEHGAVMLASVLNSPIAINASVQVVRAFVKLRQMLETHAGLARKLAELEKRYDTQFKVVFEAIRQLMETPDEADRPRIGFHSPKEP